MTSLPLNLRVMEEPDLSAVTILELESGLSSWGVLGYQRELLNPNAVLLVASEKDLSEVQGFFSGRVVSGEGELLSIAVRSLLRQAGIGSVLLAAGLQAMQERGANCCFLEVRAQNLPAIRLYEKFGFCAVGRRLRYYHDPPDDALTMVWKAESGGADAEA